jgi:hypothetical protein
MQKLSHSGDLRAHISKIVTEARDQYAKQNEAMSSNERLRQIVSSSCSIPAFYSSKISFIAKSLVDVYFKGYKWYNLCVCRPRWIFLPQTGKLGRENLCRLQSLPETLRETIGQTLPDAHGHKVDS